MSPYSQLDLQSGKRDASAPAHNFSEKQQREVNKPGNDRRITLIWGYQCCSIKQCSAGTVTGEGQMICSLVSDRFSSQSSQVFGKQNKVLKKKMEQITFSLFLRNQSGINRHKAADSKNESGGNLHGGIYTVFTGGKQGDSLPHGECHTKWFCNQICPEENTM